MLIDLICHGVPSPVFWEKHAAYLTKEMAPGTIKIRFRSKGREDRTLYALLLSGNGTSVRINHKTDAYYNQFMKSNSFRESCYLCQYACPSRVGDITLGDCATWMEHMNFYPYTATSCILINTNHGCDLWDACKKEFQDEVRFEELNIKQEVKSNQQLNQPSVRSEVRDYIYMDYACMSEEKFAQKYAEKYTAKDWIKIVVKKLIPVRMREAVRKVVLRG